MVLFCETPCLEVPKLGDMKSKGFAQLPGGHIDQQGQQNVSANHRKKTTEAVHFFWTNAALSTGWMWTGGDPQICTCDMCEFMFKAQVLSSI